MKCDALDVKTAVFLCFAFFAAPAEGHANPSNANRLNFSRPPDYIRCINLLIWQRRQAIDEENMEPAAGSSMFRFTTDRRSRRSLPRYTKDHGRRMWPLISWPRRFVLSPSLFSPVSFREGLITVRLEPRKLLTSYTGFYYTQEKRRLRVYYADETCLTH
jgi:hypothetical protein